MIVNNYQIKNVYMGNFTHGADLMQSVQSFIEEKAIKMATINLIGAAQRAKLGYYNAVSKVYEEIAIEEQVEIVSCMGNISVRDGKPMAHIHVVTSDSEGHCIAGHLLPGTIVFVSEFTITEFDGPVMERKIDPQIGVPIWSK